MDLEKIVLKRHKHGSLVDGACAMELASVLAGEDFSDHPTCVSPVIAMYMRQLNDLWDDETRQMLKPYIEKVLNTASSKHVELRRSQLAIDWLARIYAPTWLEVSGLKDEAEALRSLHELNDKSIEHAQETLKRVQQKASTVWGVARDAALSVPGNAAHAAAWSIAGDATRAAARATAGDAARLAARAFDGVAAWSITMDAAWSAASCATWSAALCTTPYALKPVVATLQASALDLIDRMTEVSE